MWLTLLQWINSQSADHDVILTQQWLTVFVLILASKICSLLVSGHFLFCNQKPSFSGTVKLAAFCDVQQMPAQMTEVFSATMTATFCATRDVTSCCIENARRFHLCQRQLIKNYKKQQLNTIIECDQFSLHTQLGNVRWRQIFLTDKSAHQHAAVNLTLAR